MVACIEEDQLLMNRKISLNSGFTLAEAIFSLFVTILVLSILQNLLFSIKKANLSENQHINNVAYAYVQLDRFMHEDAKIVYPVEIDANKNRAAFTKVNKNKQKETYYIEYYSPKHVLKVSKVQESGGGFMPLVFNIKKANFMTKTDQIHIEVFEENKGKSDLVFQLDERPKDEKNKKQKDKS